MGEEASWEVLDKEGKTLARVWVSGDGLREDLVTAVKFWQPLLELLKKLESRNIPLANVATFRQRHTHPEPGGWSTEDVQIALQARSVLNAIGAQHCGLSVELIEPNSSWDIQKRVVELGAGVGDRKGDYHLPESIQSALEEVRTGQISLSDMVPD